MGKRDYTVAEWRRIASALHYGALSVTMSFENTHSALEHLYHHGNGYATASSASSKADHARYQDYCYTHRNAPCPPTSECQLRLSTFFRVETNNRCVLCSGLTIQQTANDFTYGLTTGQVFLEEPSEGASLSLTHMKHLAVYHTPFFVMLILGSMTNKRYTLHTDPSCRQELASTVFNHYKVGQEALHTGQDHDVAFLKIWWRYMNRHSSKTINIKIPYYLELPNNAVSQYSAWNPAYDRFADRKPEPIYTFIASHCVCRDVWDESTTYNPGACKPTMRSSWHSEGFAANTRVQTSHRAHIGLYRDCSRYRRDGLGAERTVLPFTQTPARLCDRRRIWRSHPSTVTSSHELAKHVGISRVLAVADVRRRRKPRVDRR